jgi:hypothetical protein
MAALAVLVVTAYRAKAGPAVTVEAQRFRSLVWPSLPTRKVARAVLAAKAELAPEALEALAAMPPRQSLATIATRGRSAALAVPVATVSPEPAALAATVAFA